MNCPECGYPNTKDGQHFKGIYTAGKPCDHCGFIEIPPSKLEKLRETMEHEKKYPLCARLSTIRNEKLTIEEFLDWAAAGGLELCAPMPGGGGRYYPMTQARERLLLKYFKIDPSKLEEERLAILEEQRKKNVESG